MDDDGDPIFRANPVPVSTLTRQASHGELALPKFQRSFVWETPRTVKLLGSIMARYPAGTLLFLGFDRGNQVFEPREVEGAKALTKDPKALILDGQQRITALYRSRYGIGEERFFIVLERFLDDKRDVIDQPEDIEWDKAIVALPRNGRRKVKDKDYHDFDVRDWQLENWHLPVDLLPDSEGLDEFLDDLSDKQSVQKKTLRTIRRRYVSPLTAYAFPVVELAADTDLAAVCTIFETLNQSGVPLGPFELLTARFVPRGVDLRERWEKALDDYGILDEFSVEPYSVLQAVCLRAKGSAQRSDVLKLKADAVKTHWDGVVRGYAEALELVKSDCGVLTSKWLPYSMLLVPMSAVWNVVEAAKGAKRGLIRTRLQQYFWCAVFAASFDQGANSQAGADYALLKDWVTSGKNPPKAISGFGLTRAELASATVGRRALYRGVIALTVRHGGKDFQNTQRLTAERIRERKIDAHHVFPKQWITNNKPKDSEGSDLSSELLLNRALIDKETNRRIKDRAPSDYLGEIEGELGQSALGVILDSHLLPSEQSSPLRQDDYAGFLDDRLELLVQEIEDVTQQSVAN